MCNVLILPNNSLLRAQHYRRKYSTIWTVPFLSGSFLLKGEIGVYSRQQHKEITTTKSYRLIYFTVVYVMTILQIWYCIKMVEELDCFQRQFQSLLLVGYHFHYCSCCWMIFYKTILQMFLHKNLIQLLRYSREWAVLALFICPLDASILIHIPCELSWQILGWNASPSASKLPTLLKDWKQLKMRKIGLNPRCVGLIRAKPGSCAAAD